MLFTRAPKSGQHGSPIAPKRVSIFPQQQPPRLSLPKNYVPKPPPDAFALNDLVIIADEFEEYKSSGRIDETPGYRITETANDLTSSRLYYKLQDIQTLEGRGVYYERQELRPLFPRQEIGGHEGEEIGESSRLVVKDWDAQTLIGGGGGGHDGDSVGFRDDETLCGDDDDGLRDVVGRG